MTTAVANAFYAVRQNFYQTSAEDAIRTQTTPYRVINLAHKNAKGDILYALNPYTYFDESIYADPSFNFKTTNQRGKPVMFPTKDGIDYPDCSVRLYALEVENGGELHSKCYNCFRSVEGFKICDACYRCGCGTSRTPKRVLDSKKGIRHL